LAFILFPFVHPARSAWRLSVSDRAHPDMAHACPTRQDRHAPRFAVSSRVQVIPDRPEHRRPIHTATMHMAILSSVRRLISCTAVALMRPAEGRRCAPQGPLPCGRTARTHSPPSTLSHERMDTHATRGHERRRGSVAQPPPRRPSSMLAIGRAQQGSVEGGSARAHTPRTDASYTGGVRFAPRHAYRRGGDAMPMRSPQMGARRVRRRGVPGRAPNPEHGVQQAPPRRRAQRAPPRRPRLV